MKRAKLTSILLLSCLAVPGCHAQVPAMDVKAIAQAIDEGHGGQMEPALLSMHQRNPKDAEVMSLLARIEYLDAVAGLPQYPGMPPTGWDKAHMAAAEKWARQAVESDPKQANAWVVYGQIKYAQYRLGESLEMLNKAESIDPTSVKLRLRKGATLRALAQYRGDDSLLDASAREYRKVIHGKIDDGNERLAISELAEIASAKGDYDKAVQYLAQSLATASGSEAAFLLDKRAKAHLFAGNTDAALADIRKSLGIMDFGIGRQTSGMVLLVKAGRSMRSGDTASAYDNVQKAFSTRTDPRQMLSALASVPGSFPAIYALFEPHMKAAGGAQSASGVLCESAGFIREDDLRHLKELGADFDYVDPDHGTLLHCAIEENNVAAVRALLELGVDVKIRHPDGSTLLDRTLIGTSPQRREIRRLVLAKVGTPEGWKDPGVDLPAKGHWYRAERSIGISEYKTFPAGMILQAGGRCWIKGKSDICLTFQKKEGDYFGMVVIPLTRLGDLKALRQVEAPESASK